MKHSHLILLALAAMSANSVVAQDSQRQPDPDTQAPPKHIPEKDNTIIDDVKEIIRDHVIDKNPPPVKDTPTGGRG